MTAAPVTPSGPDGARAGLLRRGLRLEYLTVGWNLVEGVVAVAAAVAAGSVALLGFGIDSFVESASGSVLIWRLLAERRAADHEAVERLERRAGRLVAVSLFLLAAYITVDASLALWNRERPIFRVPTPNEPSPGDGEKVRKLVGSVGVTGLEPVTSSL